MSNSACNPPVRPSLNYHLFRKSDADDPLRHLIIDLSRACKYISYAIQTTDAGLSGSTNTFGEDQLKLDVIADDIIREYLCETGLVSSYLSEESDDIVQLDPDGEFTVAFDPLDGSSLVDANFAIGSIFGIYRSKEVMGATAREQVAALYVLYGPRTLLVYSTGQGVHEFILNDVGEFILLRENLTIAEEAKNYSPGNLRAIKDNEKYHNIVKKWLDDALTLRYSGCMVADIHHVLSKGQGIFTNVGGSKYPEGKLRLLYECGPFSYLIEQAGGASSDGSGPILDKEITAIDQRTQIICGSVNAVKEIEGMIS